MGAPKHRMFNHETIVRSISAFTGQNAVDDFCTWVSQYPAAGYTTAQADALAAGATDLEINSPSGNRRFVAYVTDDRIDSQRPVPTADLVALVQRLDSLTASDGGGVFVSLWEQWQDILYQGYSQGFTGNPAYPSLAVNGAFENTSFPVTSPASARYPFARLRARILYGQ